MQAACFGALAHWALCMTTKSTLWCFSALCNALCFFKVGLRSGNIMTVAKPKGHDTETPTLRAAV
jgi:hypothetical protein